MAVYIQSESIVSPLGIGAEVNFLALQKGESGIQKHVDANFNKESFWASIVPEQLLSQPENSPLTANSWNECSKLEKMIFWAICDAIQLVNVNLSDSKTILIFTTTKGNIHLADKGLSEDLYLSSTAQKVGQSFGNPNQVLTISNACISGLSGLLVGKRLLEQGIYEKAIVFGADLFSEFTFSGFTSFKAISPVACQPYDVNRQGINLGEAASAIVLSKEWSEIELIGGASSNDANHISGPSRTGEGLKIAINNAMQEAGVRVEDLGFISLHGTGTTFNDEMECQALNGLGLEKIPSHSLKAYYGHTLGAAGVLESAISIQMLRKGKTLPSKGFMQAGTTLSMHIENKVSTLEKPALLKTASGFGGCNAALVFRKSELDKKENSVELPNLVTSIPFELEIRPGEIIRNGEVLYSQHFFGNTDEWLNQAFRDLTPGYLKFFKMDRLCKLGMLGLGLLLKNNTILGQYASDEVALVFANRSSSLDTDLVHQASLMDKANYFPSPAVFVYTLPNIILGEAAIKYGFKGENIFLVMPELDEKILRQQVESLFYQSLTKLVIVGWIELLQDKFQCKLGIIEKSESNSFTFTPPTISKIP
jgi:3-oxoacyl-(acyl-carrier-protein) synthase